MEIPAHTSKEDISKRQQANLSIGLIVANIVVLLIYLNCTYNSENDRLYHSALICPAISVLIGIYTFTYRGKKFRIGRILFYVFLALSILSLCMLYYIIGLGAAFAH